MTQYIYFVKCPDFEDESFNFFDDAKLFARGCLSSKPVICQVEVNRNDFGECTDSTDPVQVWSWEDEMSDVPEDELTTLSKDETFGTHAFDLDFDDADVSGTNSILDTVPDNFRRPVPADMAIEDLVEAMEENEEMVECKECFNLVSKEACTKLDKGYVCAACSDGSLNEDSPSLRDIANNTEDFIDEEDFEDDEDTVQCTWCEDTFDRSESKLTESLILCPECGAYAFNRITEACKNCGFDTSKIMLEDAPLNNFVQNNNATSTDDTKTGDAVTEDSAAGQKSEPVDTKAIVDEVVEEVKQVADTVIDAVNKAGSAATSKFVEVGKVLAQNDQKIYDAVEDVMFELA